MKWLRDLSIDIKIAAIVIAAISVMALSILALETNSTGTLIQETGQQRLQEEISIIETNLRDAQEDLETAVTVLANTPGLVDAVAEENLGVLQSLVLGIAPTLNIDDFDIFNAEGERLVDTEEEEEGGDEDFLLEQSLLGIQRTSIIVESEEDEGDEGEGELVLFIASTRPLRDASGTIVGGFVVSREIDDEFLAELNFNREDVELGLIYEGDVIADSARLLGSEEAIEESELQSTLLAQALSGDIAINPNTVLTGNSIPHTEAYLPVQGLGDRSTSAVLLVSVSVEALSTFQNELVRNSTIVLAALALVMIAALIFRMRFMVVRRIRLLQSATDGIAQGDYTKRASVTSEDEIGQLAIAFNQMASDIQQRQTDLQELNQSLEQRIADRTVDMKKARDEALAAQRLANENSRLKSEFLSTMSHELRTPMNAIEGFTGIILNGMGGSEFNDKTERYLQKVQSNSRRLLNLINDFLDLSRIESGRLELVYMPISPIDLAQRWEENISVLAANKDLNLNVTVDPNLPETMLGDEESLTKVAINLLGNAIKFTEEGSVSLKLEKQDEQMAIIIQDTGVGIPPQAREYIFEEFRQVDQSSTRVHGGTGLGLAIVQKLVREMKGTVSLDSEVGVGSTFTVLIPIQTEKQAT